MLFQRCKIGYKTQIQKKFEYKKPSLSSNNSIRYMREKII